MNTNRDREGALFESALPLQTQLLKRARYVMRAGSDADDLVQDTFERALRSSTTPFEAADLQRWLARVLTNLWIDQARTRKARRGCHRKLAALAGTTQPEVSEGERWQDLSLAEVRAALAEVPEPYRSTYQHHVLERRSYTRIAGETGIRPGTVGTRLLRARRYLRQILEERLTIGGAAAAEHREPPQRKRHQSIEEKTE